MAPRIFKWGWRAANGSGAAEARKINAEADNIIIGQLRSEIERLDGEMKQLRSEFASARQAADDEKARLEKENRYQKGQIRRLETRVSGLESILSIGPITPEMKAALDELDRTTETGK